jgi:hypothetical protein
MKAHTLFSASRGLLVAMASALPTLGLAGDLVLQKAPPLTVREAPAYPQNLARYHLGAGVKAAPQSVPLSKLQLSINSQDQNTAEAALLCDDPTTGYQLPAGATTVLISLSNIENIQSLSFQSEGAQGNFDVAVSNADVPATSPEWRKAGSGEMADGAVVSKIGPGEAKYVRLSFHATKPGRIAALGIYATPALSDFTMPRPSKVSFVEETAAFALINFNFSEVHARARALYASSGDLEQANNMLDDQPATVYQFAAGDTSPTTVIDLGQERSLTRLSAVYAAQPGSVEFYVLDSLPQTSPNDSQMQKIANPGQSADLPDSLHISQEAFAGLKPVGAVVSTGEGRAAVDFPAVTGRYVMLKWHPASMQGTPFSIAQVAAFGPTTRTTANGQAYDSKDGKEIFDDKRIPAVGPEEAPTPEEGPAPALPPVPPFTFIPQVPPTSP